MSRHEKTKVFEERRNLAMKRKEKMFLDKIKQNIYYMNRWNIVREKRKDIEEINRQENQKQLFKFWWIRKCYAKETVKVIFSLFDQTRKEYYQAIKEKLTAMRIARLYKAMARRRGEDYEDRVLNQIRHSNAA